MPYAPQCQPIADQVSALTVQEKAQLAAIDPLEGAARWKAIEDLGTLRQQIADQQSVLDACQKQHGLDLTAEIVVFDLTGDAGANRIGRLWQLTAGGQAVKQTNSIQADNLVSFPGILGANRQAFGITIEGVDKTTVNGPDFRSGPLPASAGAAVNEIDPVGRIEIVILSPMTISTDTLKQALPPLPLQQSIPVEAAGNVGIAITALDFVIDNGTVSLTASGTASALSATSPFTFSAAVHIAPVFTMTPSTIFDVSMVGVPTLTMSGFAGSIVQLLAPFVSTSLSGQIVQQLDNVLSTFVGARVAESLGSSAIPAGSVLSVRELTIDAAQITITPVLGAFGTILSTFKPAALPAPSSLAAIALSVATVGTESVNAVDGRVDLTIAAPAGGATIQLSTARSDLLEFDADSLTIPEGQVSGAFVITAIPPPIAITTPVDCAVYASLGEQRVQTTLTVVAQTPTGAPAAPPPSTPATAVTTGVASIAVSPNPITPFSTVTGTITLNGLSVTSTVVTITFDGVSLPPTTVLIPPNVVTASFTFSLADVLPQPVIGITASAGSGNAVSIKVPVA